MDAHYEPAPDAEAETIRYLGACGIKASTELPSKPTWPALTLCRIGGGTSPAHRLDRARIQLSAWGASKGEARALMAQALARLWEMPIAYAGTATVTDVAADLGMTWNPDDSATPPRPRYIAGVQITFA